MFATTESFSLALYIVPASLATCPMLRARQPGLHSVAVIIISST